MIRKHKKFSKPRTRFDSTRIEEEDKIVERYGLKNKREIWKAKGKLERIRNIAKKLIDSSQEEQEKFLVKLKKQGFDVKTTVDVLALTEEEILKRRLQTIVYNKKLSTTPKGARQLITHKNILVNGRIVNIPSYMVEVDEENMVKLAHKKRIVKPVSQEIPEEIIVENKEEIIQIGEIENG
ncbi:30S ribosomal protein S4 [Candidatus Pacearchaeota archaeon]|nr:30S ribosomal protein S4 [Candidatus Pacearchaeota archaeon]